MLLPAYLASVHHDGSPRYVSNPYPRLGETVRLRIRTAPDAPIRTILLRTVPDGEQTFTEMTPLPPGAACRWWEVELPITTGIMTYRFVLAADDGLWTYTGLGAHEHTPTDYHDFRLIADYTPPRWASRSVFYQIFPDRFADGDPSTNVQTDEWSYHGASTLARAWDEPPGVGNVSLEFYGGDLQGIVQRLDYLADLGVDALYLTPIFTAPSVHRYDVTDYEQVDPHLGGNAALAELRAALSAREMRLMLDIVPNHCGVEHPWFQTALRDAASARSNFFIFTQHPHEYASWLGVRTLPKLDYRSSELREYMYAGAESIFRRWMRPPYSIDGWRVDVANMLGQHGPSRLSAEIARGIRAAVKAENGDSYLISENFFDATPSLQGDQYDANMNYRGFTTPLWDWISPRVVRQPGTGVALHSYPPSSTEALVDAWAMFRTPIAWAIAARQFTLVDSHDTMRIRSKVEGSDGLHRLAAVLQFTYPGVPCIFYGDEIGLEGANATMARRTMPWDSAAWDHKLRAFYQQLIRLRRSSAALAEGGLQLLDIDADTVIFLRDAEAEQIIVVGYRGAAERPAQRLPVSHAALADGTRLRELLTGAESVVEAGALPLPPMAQGGAIWQTI